MSKVTTFKHLLLYDRKGLKIAVFSYIVKSGVLNRMSDEKFIKLLYYMYTGKRINLDDPQLLNEKMQWLKLYNRNPLYTNLVDKAKVKEIVAEELGIEYVVPTIGLYKSFDDINFDVLPEKFVMKCTHDSGSTIICENKDKLNKDKVKKKLKKKLNRNLFYWGREYPYKNVTPQIIIEKYINSTPDKTLVDYKFFCYGGKPIYFMYSIGEAERHAINHKFNMNLESIDYLFKEVSAIDVGSINLPSNINEMIKIVERLCMNFPLVRIDLYNIEGKIYFGEYTFSPNNGFINMVSDEFSQKLASLIDVDKIKQSL